jgi:hypothetical protein
MLIIYASIIIILFLLFWQVIYKIIISYLSNSLKSNNTLLGNIWFIFLFIINISIIIFIYVFYNNKATTPGSIGQPGDRGFEGQHGDLCYIKSNNCSSVTV